VALEAAGALPIPPSDMPQSGDSDCISTPRGSERDVEEAIEVATTLGVDTEPAEERMATLRRMLSVRAVWDGLARFFLLPLRSSFDALMREVLSKYGQTAGSAVDLVWCEGDMTFPLDSQSAWQDCLQRRGLVEKPGRLEIHIQSRRVAGTDSTPTLAPRRKRPVVSLRLPAEGAVVAPVGVAEAEGAQPTPANAMDFLVTGTQALRSSATNASAGGHEKSGAKTRAGTISGKPRRIGTAVDGGRQVGKAWAMATGRDQPVFWNSRGGGRISPQPPVTGYTPPEGLCLEGRAAATARRQE